MDTQPTFAELEYDQKKKTTHRARFLARMDALIPWEELEAEMAPFYPRRGQGRPPDKGTEEPMQRENGCTPGPSTL